MEDKILRNIFDPGFFGIKTHDFDSQETKDKKILERSEFEKLAYEEITQELINDLKDLGIPINYATKIIIGQLAFDLILFSRLKFYSINRELTSETVNYKPWLVKPSEKVNDTKVIEYYGYDSKEVIHPIYNDFIFKLQKNINKLLSLAGLLPRQQLERKKVIFVEKLKKRLVSIENKDIRYSLEMSKSNKI